MKKFIFKRLKRLQNKNVNNFTSNFGLKLRKIMHKPISMGFKIILKLVYKQNVIIDKKGKLSKKKNYVFAANHSFYFDGSSMNSVYLILNVSSSIFLRNNFGGAP